MTNKSHMTLGILLAACLMATACIGPDESNKEPTLEFIQATVFDTSCAAVGCHNSVTQAGGLNLSTIEDSYDALVMVPAKNSVASENGWLRVKPYEPESSFLIRKIIEPGTGEGAVMPMGQTDLTDDDLQLLSEWIALGAEI